MNIESGRRLLSQSVINCCEATLTIGSLCAVCVRRTKPSWQLTKTSKQWYCVYWRVQMQLWWMSLLISCVDGSTHACTDNNTMSIVGKLYSGNTHHFVAVSVTKQCVVRIINECIEIGQLTFTTVLCVRLLDVYPMVRKTCTLHAQSLLTLF